MSAVSPPPLQLENRHVVVLGLAQSGVAAARLCHDRGARVTGTDAHPAPPGLEELAALGIEILTGDPTAEAARSADIVVVSPGVGRLPVLDECERRGALVIGELELGVRHLNAPVLAVGGTNGKSTTTKLCAEMLVASGRSVFVGGNYGTPVCAVAGQSFDVAVLEVSSFQLERAPTFRPRASILLNISEDHLDRYATFEDYAHAKGNAFVNQDTDDVAIVELSDVASQRQAARGGGRRMTYGTGPADYALQGSTLVERASQRFIELGRSQLHGRHNWLNAAAAVAASRVFTDDWDSLDRALARFEPLPHRMSRVAELRGVSFYDDSKGTNVGAAVTALLGLAEPKAVLIAGGRDKQGSYEPLVEALRARGRALVVLGEARERIRAAADGALPVVEAGSMPEAVRRAFDLAQPGDAVLLSPACSSFDMYRGYAERGDDFQQNVRLLVDGGAPAGASRPPG